VRPCGRATGVAGEGLVQRTLAELDDYLLDVILIRAYLCDVALNDVLCDNRRDFHVLVANKRIIMAASSVERVLSIRILNVVMSAVEVVTSPE
jgi:hypothetical protein